MKGDLAGAWSPTRAFTVNNDHAKRPLKHRLTAQSPLFTLEATRVLAYPQWYDGDALACRVGDALAIPNSRENEDVTESYSIPLTAGWLRKRTGKISPHSFLIGKLEDQGRQFWFQTNSEYPDRESIGWRGDGSGVHLGVDPPLRWQIITSISV